MNRISFVFQAGLVALALLVAGCASRTIQKQADPTDWANAGLKPRTSLPQDQRIKVAVLDFADLSEFGKGKLGRGAATVFVTVLSRSGQFSIYEREKLPLVFAEQGITENTQLSAEQAAKIGKTLGVDYVFLGVVSNYGYRSKRTRVFIFGDKVRQQAEATVDVRLIDVATGRIVASESGSGVVTVTTGHVLGVGTSAGYDETTAMNALRAAICQYVDVLIDESLANR
jgi:curli biogenesis system outer membrane secretion channel CsgG